MPVDGSKQPRTLFQVSNTVNEKEATDFSSSDVLGGSNIHA